MEAGALAQRVLESRARRNPAWATQVGLREHDHRLRASSREAIESEAQEVASLLAEARALPRSLDARALTTALALDDFELRVARTWARNPDLAAEFFEHLLATLLAAHLTSDERATSLAARLEGASKFFADAWPRFDAADVPGLWVQGARKSVEGADAFFAAVRESVSDAAPTLRQRVERALAPAESVLRAHAQWLDRLLADARGEFALGDERFRELLRVRRIPDAPHALVELGEATVARFRGQMEEAAQTVLAEAGKTPDDDPPREALEIVSQDHPRSFAEVLESYRNSIRAARERTLDENVCDVPDVPLDVVETPAFLRHLVPFAAYQGPARFASPTRGVYFVTPKVELSSFPRADTRNVTVHEAYPGHHVQISVAAQKASLAAFLCEVPDMTEGWALYCEVLMGERGYTSAPAERLIRARDARWRAVRIVLDVALHTGRTTPAEAAARLAAETGMGIEEADAEVLRYTLAPTYNLSYMWGRLRIERMREQARERGISDRAFHDRLLSLGSIPVALAQEALEREDIRQG